jgi:hypothetical protein
MRFASNERRPCLNALFFTLQCNGPVARGMHADALMEDGLFEKWRAALQGRFKALLIT